MATVGESPGPTRPRPGFRTTREVLVRGVGLCYAAAFGSLAVQVVGLIGRHGVAPAGEFLDRVRAAIGPLGYWQVPTLLWLNASDAALLALCWGGVALGLMVAAGLLPKAGLALAWVFYLSLTSAGQEFLGYQWDALLLESGLLGVLVAPWGLRPGRGAGGPEPPRVVIWLFRWLVFRLMFQSGLAKLTSGDPTWRAWQALRYHYETQPLPTWVGWYAHQAPAWFQSASVGFMFWAELVAPFGVVGPRPLRRLACGSMVALMLGIAATGNYGFFNILSVVLCASLLDDRDWGREAPPVADATTRPAPVWRRLALYAAAAVLAAVTAMNALEVVARRVTYPWPLEIVRRAVEPFRSTNTYGLFAVMTTERPEVVVEGSDDGLSWRPYGFRWKPGATDRRPRFAYTHLPRLDWQMWFAALSGHCGSEPWFLRFERRLLQGSPEVLALLRDNPFPARPPRFLRARLFLYRFTRGKGPGWWTRREAGTFCPPLRAGDFGPD